MGVLNCKDTLGGVEEWRVRVGWWEGRGGVGGRVERDRGREREEIEKKLEGRLRLIRTSFTPRGHFNNAVCVLAL